MTKTILEKYEYNLPVNITNQKFNKYIKEVCDAAEIKKRIKKGITKGVKREYEIFFKHELITSHKMEDEKREKALENLHKQMLKIDKPVKVYLDFEYVKTIR